MYTLKRYLATAFVPFVALACVGLRPGLPEEPPRLTVVLVVDQMRADYLERYAELFEGGFARILADGAVFTEAYQDHAATVTAVGHATIATGVLPARHGIVGNDFFDRPAGRTAYSASDPDAPILDHPGAPGRSPLRLRRSGLADWLHEASPESRIFSTALKDRSAIMMGGRTPDGAYWYHEPAEEIVTSVFYESEYPDWVREFVSRDRVGSHEDFLYTPFADEMILQFAQAAIENEGLGADDIPDLLFIGASAADYIGHRWGPYSQEVEDYYVRLDRYLGVLFDYLDKKVGPDRWALVLASDHGVAPAPEESARRGEDARRISTAEFSREVRAALATAIEESGIEPAPTFRWMDGPHLLSETASPEELRELRRAIADRFAEIDFVAAAFTSDEVAEADPRGDDIISRFRRSFDPERSPDVMYELRPNYITGATTATHGSPHWYDMHVPLVFMGPGIPSGRHDQRVQTIDIAPTLARLLGIPAPGDLDGRALTLY